MAAATRLRVQERLVLDPLQVFIVATTAQAYSCAVLIHAAILTGEHATPCCKSLSAA